MGLKLRLIASASGALFGALALQAHAEDPAPPPSTLEEVIVTAQKIETNLQRTPLAVSALSGEALTARRITDVQALMSAMPNVDFGSNLGNPRLAVRGIGFDNITVGNEARIAFHQDGVYLSRPASTLAGFYDIERVEVLRGPQGALYGRNATGGAVNVITKAPTSDLQGYLNVSLGNYGLFQTEGAVSGQIAPKVTGRLAFRTESHDGYGKDETNGVPVDDKDTRAVRGKLRFDLADNFYVGLQADYMHENDHAYGYVYMAQNPSTNPAMPGAVSPRPLSGVLLGGTVPSKVRDITGDVPTTNRREFYGVSTDWHLTLGEYELISILSYRRSDIDTVTDLDQTSAPIAFNRQDERSDQYSVEARIQHQFEHGDWLLGVYGFREKLEGGFRVPDNARVPPTFNPLNPAIACGGAPCTAAYLAPFFSQGFWQYGFLKTNAEALFGSFHYEITDKVGIRLGARYSSEKKAINELSKTDLVTPFPPFLEPFPAPSAGASYARQITSKSYTAFTPSVTVDYQATEKLYLYATVSKGFKSGGFNLGNAQPAFNPEKIIDYEAGLKADWLDGRLRTNFAAFAYDYTDVQLTKVQGVPPGIVIFNAPGAKVKGVELELTALPIDHMRVELNYGYVDSHYDGPFTTVDSARPWLGALDLAGNQLTQAPKHTANLAAEYTWPTDIGDITLRGETQYKSLVYFSGFNLPYLAQPAHWTSNAFLSLQSRNQSWRATAYVRNLTNALVRASMTVGPTFYGSPLYGTFEPPRTYGVDLSYRF